MFDELGVRSSAFEAQCPVMKASRVHGLGGIFRPPHVQPRNLVYYVKSFAVARCCDSLIHIGIGLLCSESTDMGNSFGFLRGESGSGFQFNVVEACKAEDVDLAQACSLTFGAYHDLIAIGNVTRGRMVPQPGIAGIGASQGGRSQTLYAS